MRNKKIGIVWSSSKPSEQRIPLVPEHLFHLRNTAIWNNLIFENGYGADYQDAYVMKGANFATREEVMQQDIVMIAKPMPKDLRQMKDGATLCGWVHTVQQHEIAQVAIDKKLSLMAWENMYGENGVYLFHRNRELAGYCSILQMLQLIGIDGFYGPRRSVAIFGFGMTSRGAIHALLGRGFENIHVYTQRPSHLVANKHPNVYYHHYRTDEFNQYVVDRYGEETDLILELSKHDIIVNAILQDVNNPVMFVKNEDELCKLQPGTIIVDISIDKGMGFYFAEPTSIANPIIDDFPNNIKYYACDHSPSYLKLASSREVSTALFPYLHEIINPDTTSPTVLNSYDVVNGIIKNENVIKFQKRVNDYPYEYINPPFADALGNKIKKVGDEVAAEIKENVATNFKGVGIKETLDYIENCKKAKAPINPSDWTPAQHEEMKKLYGATDIC